MMSNAGRAGLVVVVGFWLTASYSIYRVVQDGIDDRLLFVTAVLVASALVSTAWLYIALFARGPAYKER